MRVPRNTVCPRQMTQRPVVLDPDINQVLGLRDSDICTTYEQHVVGRNIAKAKPSLGLVPSVALAQDFRSRSPIYNDNNART